VRFVLIFLAVFGVLAVLSRIARAGFRLLHRGVDAFIAREVTELRAQKGDLTGMADAAQQRGLARRRRLVAAGTLSFWVVLLVAPPLTPWPEVLYAMYSVLWFIPHELRRT
jgi:hypothetical protein